MLLVHTHVMILRRRISLRWKMIRCVYRVRAKISLRVETCDRAIIYNHPSALFFHGYGGIFCAKQTSYQAYKDSQVISKFQSAYTTKQLI